MYGNKYTEEMQEFILNNYKGITSQELADKFSEHFGVIVKASQMKSFKGNHRLASGVDRKFVKGQVSHNKGMKGCYAGCEKGWFPKGNTPHNHKPVGSERLSKDGYIEIKVAEPKKWRLKHNVVWEDQNGKIPRNHVVIFLDGNKLNLDISNLKLVSRSELLIMNRYDLFQPDAELTEVATTLAKVIDAKCAAKKRK